ncbi:ATG12/APG12 putative (ATG12) [Leptomonas pyrrhocoris]|uniref:Autophagy-related protein n=1 Tax=Leptomonas pyrrhocoris TaxID=157538 RepID=A0A0N0DZX5_LEPPY|nr:ATG12/APG12 putative (ATG12) [Leptomonas pyrrhocoris]KPA85775.1 ATG12/APG12 putative (ATG12) [Leptomonas pyrrhocoris]|eukprot:XP_015664214.1 ATG12/APG12 putative (ATG12) [Leptomonas pyrrhocoris]
MPRHRYGGESSHTQRRGQHVSCSEAKRNGEAERSTSGDGSAATVPALQVVHSPAYHTASLCSSSASSDAFVSPCDSEHGDGLVDESSLPCESTIAINSTGSKERQRSSREVRVGRQVSDRHAQPEQRAFAAPTLPTASTIHATHNQEYPSRVSNPAASSSHAAASPSLSPPPPPRTHFQYVHSFEYRCCLAAKIRALYGAESIPVIVEPAESHLRTPSPSAPPYESPRLAAETRIHIAGIGQGLLARFRTQETSTRSSSAGTTTSPPLQASTASALASPSTRSTLKCVLPRSKTVAEVILTLRDRLALDSCQSLFLSVGESDALVPGNSLLGDLYQRYHHRDGLLYLSYLLENTFG